MKVEVLTESPADDAALEVLLQAVLGAPTETASRRDRPGGWNAVLRILPTALKALHYRRDADALVVVLDSNGSPVCDHVGWDSCGDGKCRLCAIRTIVSDVRQSLTPLPGYDPIKVAVGMAVPAVEAWYLCGTGHAVSEVAWINGAKQGQAPYDKRQLKRWVYGTDRPSLQQETESARQEMLRVVQDLEAFGRRFPIGFGSLLHDLRNW